MRAKQRTFGAVLLVLSMLSSAGCAVAHRYPAYRGRVLELGTDKPIEGAGVLAVYDYRQFSGIDVHSAYLGYQAVLTNTDGKFEVPVVWFMKLMPLSWFDDDVSVTIYKRGYGNFPGSSGSWLSKQWKTDVKLPRGDWLPPEREVTFWLPKLETDDEIAEHGKFYVPQLPLGAAYPPGGMKPEQFGLYPGYFKKKGDK